MIHPLRLDQPRRCRRLNPPDPWRGRLLGLAGALFFVGVLLLVAWLETL